MSEWKNARTTAPRRSTGDVLLAVVDSDNVEFLMTGWFDFENETWCVYTVNPVTLEIYSLHIWEGGNMYVNSWKEIEDGSL